MCIPVYSSSNVLLCISTASHICLVVKRYTAMNNVVEAHCYPLQCRRIDCEQLHSVNYQLIDMVETQLRLQLFSRYLEHFT